METLAADKLLLFIGFVIPGFIGLKIYSLLYPSIRKNSGDQLIDAIAYSCLNYALLAYPIFLIETSSIKSTQPSLYLLFLILAIFVAPVLWILVLRKIRMFDWVQNFAPHPIGKPWDYVFGQRCCYWIIATLKNGKKIAGKYSGKSFTTSAPDPEQIYLEETWLLNADGGFERPCNETAGVLILSTEIETIELFNLERNSTNDSQK